MARPFPFSEQQDTMYCCLSPQEVHDRVMVDLDQTVLFSVMEGHQLPSSFLFALRLQARYGGMLDDWSPTPVNNGFLLKVPNWFTPDQLEGDAMFWERYHALLILPWQTQNRTDPLPARDRVHITIHRFPIDYWHPFYFRQAVSGMGVLAGVSQEALTGSHKAYVQLAIDCCDIGFIHRRLIVGHGGLWSECLVDLHGRDALFNEGPLSPPPPEVNQGQPRACIEAMAAHTGPYLPLWRRRVIQCRVLMGDLTRRGAPTAVSEAGGAQTGRVNRA